MNKKKPRIPRIRVTAHRLPGAEFVTIQIPTGDLLLEDIEHRVNLAIRHAIAKVNGGAR
jgi:hypothetical protein